ncbi:hypothetical protein ACFQZI_15175 [Mucilaginibacter lutimaris]|uniref:Uncharacterized protein n=1 Tax=Mucilaginibacter lutimaris TaxID=931629 RepID=A0ABW2ZJ03_9SPHI
MLTIEEVYAQDPTQKVIDEGAGWGAEQMLKAGIPIFYRDEQYPETMEGNLFVKEYTSGAKFIVKKELTADLRLLEEIIRPLNAL